MNDHPLDRKVSSDEEFIKAMKDYEQISYDEIDNYHNNMVKYFENVEQSFVDGEEEGVFQAALKYERLDVIESLIQSGYDPCGADQRGSRIVKTITFAKNSKFACLVIDYLLSKGADINGESLGGSALFCLVRREEEGRDLGIIAKCLIDHGIDRSSKENGKTAYRLAKHLNAVELAKIIRTYKTKSFWSKWTK